MGSREPAESPGEWGQERRQSRRFCMQVAMEDLGAASPPLITAECSVK